MTKREYVWQKGKTCSGPKCQRPAKVKGKCMSHYSQWYRGGELKPIKEKVASL